MFPPFHEDSLGILGRVGVISPASSPTACAKDQCTRGKRTQLMEGDSITKSMMTLALILMAGCGEAVGVTEEATVKTTG